MSGFSLATSSCVTSFPFSKSIIDPDSSASKRRRKLANSSSGCMVTSPIALRSAKHTGDFKTDPLPSTHLRPTVPGHQHQCGIGANRAANRSFRDGVRLARSAVRRSRPPGGGPDRPPIPVDDRIGLPPSGIRSPRFDPRRSRFHAGLGRMTGTTRRGLAEAPGRQHDYQFDRDGLYHLQKWTPMEMIAAAKNVEASQSTVFLSAVFRPSHKIAR